MIHTRVGNEDFQVMNMNLAAMQLELTRHRKYIPDIEEQLQEAAQRITALDTKTTTLEESFGIVQKKCEDAESRAITMGEKRGDMWREIKKLLSEHPESEIVDVKVLKARLRDIGRRAGMIEEIEKDQ